MLSDTFGFFADSIFLYPLLAGIMIAIAASPFGCLVLWKRYVFFGDSIAHLSLTPVALGTFFAAADLAWLPLVACAIIMAVLLVLLQHYSQLFPDTILGILSHAGLAVGVLVALWVNQYRPFDFEQYLFGHFLTIDGWDLFYIALFSVIALFGVAQLWRRLLIILFNPDIAVMEGISLLRVELWFAVLLAMTIICAIQVIGLLLTVAILVIPAATARAGQPKTAVIQAGCFGLLAMVVGLCVAFIWDLPPGPAIILTAMCPLIVRLIIDWRQRVGTI